MTTAQIRRALPAIYAIAVVLTALLTTGTVLVVVAVVGAMLLGLAYTLLPSPTSGRQRSRQRSRRQA